MDVVDEIRIQWGFDDKLIRSGSVGTFPLHVFLPPPPTAAGSRKSELCVVMNWGAWDRGRDTRVYNAR